MWFALLFSSLLLISEASTSCPTGFSALNSKCVKLVTDAAKHSDASTNCALLGGHLVSIPNAIDNTAITKLAADSTTPFWIGIKCSSSNLAASCLWDDQSGNAGTYNNFASAYPNVDIGSCVYVPTSGSLAGKWLSGDCSSMYLNYVCETSASVDNTCTFQYNGYCYYPTLSGLPEVDAQFACQQDCASIVSIHSLKENTYIQTLFSNNVPNYIRIGAVTSDQNVNSWLDGTTWDYTNIGYASTKLGNCWSMALKDDIVSAGMWINSQCNTSLPFVCKRPVGQQCGTTPSPTLSPSDCTKPMFYDNSGTFFSPNWPYTYTGEQNPCRYVLDTPDGTLAQIQFPVMQLDGQASITVYSHIEDTTPLVVLEGNSASSNWYTSTTNTMKIEFRPCVSACDQGLYRWQANFKPSVQATASPSVTVTPDPNNPSGCNASILVAPGLITSPNYPSAYSNFLDCRYHLSTSGGFRIKLDFNAIDTEQCCDIIVVHDGPNVSSPEIGRASGSWPAHSKIFVSTSNSMLVTFSSDASTQGSGFSANFGAY